MKKLTPVGVRACLAPLCPRGQTRPALTIPRCPPRRPPDSRSRSRARPPPPRFRKSQLLRTPASQVSARCASLRALRPPACAKAGLLRKEPAARRAAGLKPRPGGHCPGFPRVSALRGPRPRPAGCCARGCAVSRVLHRAPCASVRGGGSALRPAGRLAGPPLAPRPALARASPPPLGLRSFHGRPPAACGRRPPAAAGGSFDRSCVPLACAPPLTGPLRAARPMARAYGRNLSVPPYALAWSVRGPWGPSRVPDGGGVPPLHRRGCSPLWRGLRALSQGRRSSRGVCSSFSSSSSV